MTNVTSASLLAMLAELHPAHIELSLERMWRLLAALDAPQQRLAPVIHIAGTNGKGSTLTFLQTMLKADGARVHSYTSPHLCCFHERITLANNPIDESELVAVLSDIIDANAGREITFFEATTAAAFYTFAQHAADYLLLEVGLGGRQDATNVVDPHLSIITMIDYDHQKFLGDSLTQIAHEKAGILKSACPIISAPQHPVVADVLIGRAKEFGASFALGGRDWQVRADGDGFIFDDADAHFVLPYPSLRGAHQYINAGCALAAARKLGLERDAMARGLETTQWPGRLQNIRTGRLAAKIIAQLPDAEIWLDGAHNPAGAHALAAWAQAAPQPPRPLHIICGLLANKDAHGFIHALDIQDAHWHMIPIAGHESHAPGVLVEIAQSIRGGIPQAHSNLDDALAGLTTGTATILICGSLYLIGDVLTRNAA